nr:MAG TPA: hypothetical protein [Caudoviricetes sp.]
MLFNVVPMSNTTIPYRDKCCIKLRELQHTQKSSFRNIDKKATQLTFCLLKGSGR